MSEQAEAPVLTVTGLVKTFHIGFFRKKVEAVRGVDFEVRRGEVFGLLGPNGAGKTTTIKSLLGLIFPTAGEIRLFGEPQGRKDLKARLGYMPENPYVYQYLKPLEFLDLCGRLVGWDASRRQARAQEMVELVGLGHATDRPIGKFSKGMMQRVGLAQALLHDPELLVLDEPMSGLDPVGRKEVRDVLLAQREAGKTLLFTSHILSDVEMLCDRVAILQKGKRVHYGTLDELVEPAVRVTEIELDLESGGADARGRLAAFGELRPVRTNVVLAVEGEGRVGEALSAALAGGARVVSVTPRRETLEDVFLRDAGRDPT